MGEFMHNKQPKPFLKWAGGKTQLLGSIQTHFPYSKENEFVYIEPFVGSGAVLFWVLNNYPNIQNAIINDINTDLINTYNIVKTDVKRLVKILKEWESEYHKLAELQELKKEYYYSKRDLFNERCSDDTTQASLFIFLNRTCFNGLYRVNKRNKFNVPIGSYKTPMICDKDNLYLVSGILKNVHFLNGDFEDTKQYADENTFFYLDPPYKPVSKTSSFNSYAKGSFNDDEQKRLNRFCAKLSSEGHRFLLSNSDVKGKDVQDDDFFDRLYRDFKIERVSARRNINSKSSKRGYLTELLISN